MESVLLFIKCTSVQSYDRPVPDKNIVRFFSALRFDAWITSKCTLATNLAWVDFLKSRPSHAIRNSIFRANGDFVFEFESPICRYVMQNDRNHRFNGYLFHCFCLNVFTFRVIRKNIYCFTNKRKHFVEIHHKLIAEGY